MDAFGATLIVGLVCGLALFIFLVGCAIANDSQGGDDDDDDPYAW